jgi:IS5 family transposase
MTAIPCLFFSGQFKKGKSFPDPDAKIGYCAAKKLAFVGYRATIIIGNDKMPILDYYITPANRHDSKALLPLLLSMEAHDILPCVGAFYGDNAYCTEMNNRWLEYHEISNKFHTKDETGKYPKNKAQAKRKSRIRSKVETTFGIMEENYNFGATRVRGLNRVKVETSLICSAWNHFFLLSYFMDQFDDCISLRRLFYED